MRFLIVLVTLAAVALANPIITIRVNVDGEGGPNPPGPPGPEPDPELPPPQPYTKQQLKRDAGNEAALSEPANEDSPVGTLVNIEVFVNNQREGRPPVGPGVPEDIPPPQPY